MSNLLDLSRRALALTEPDRALDCAIAVAALDFFEVEPKWEGGPVGYGYTDADGAQNRPGHGGDQLVPRLTGSVDAAMRLRLAVSWLHPILDYSQGSVRLVNGIGLPIRGDDHLSQGELMPAVLCAALLKALAAQEFPA